MGKKLRGTILGLGLAVSGLILPISSVNAQDLLPRDNGIFSYHEAPRWRESESHPLRLTAYVLHPVGWLMREAVFRPWSAFAGSTQFTRSFFGFREPFDYREPVCFDAQGAIPDCRALPPMSTLATGPSNSGLGGASDSSDAGAGAQAMSERQVFFPDVAFEFDKSKLNALGQGRVRQIAQLLASVPSLTVVVEGHADPRGTEKYNEKLGMARARTVVSELAELGIDPARLSAVTFGETRPIFSENTEWAYAVNRRVQFTVGPEKVASAEKKSE